MELDKNNLKLQAYKEKLIALEEANADLRVEFTMVSHRNQELVQELEGLRAQLSQYTVEDNLNESLEEK